MCCREGPESGAVVGDGGQLRAENGGVAESIIVFTGGTAAARVAGRIIGAEVDGGEIDALQSGVVIGATVSHGGHLEVFFDGAATVTDGAHTVRLAMLGSYVAANFHLADDNHGGTLVFDPPVDSSGHLAPPH